MPLPPRSAALPRSFSQSSSSLSSTVTHRMLSLSLAERVVIKVGKGVAACSREGLASLVWAGVDEEREEDEGKRLRAAEQLDGVADGGGASESGLDVDSADGEL